ncbi:DNA adenine methylase, partial [Cereibacter johrii]
MCFTSITCSATASAHHADPPYFGGENDYGKGLFDRAQFARIAEILGSLKGAFLLSINDTPEIRALFGRFHLEPVRLNYSVSAAGSTEAQELLVSNRERIATL